ncbi:MAG: hypothetical protein WDN09_03110 [bacterium]
MINSTNFVTRHTIYNNKYVHLVLALVIVSIFYGGYQVYLFYQSYKANIVRIDNLSQQLAETEAKLNDTRHLCRAEILRPGHEARREDRPDRQARR